MIVKQHNSHSRNFPLVLYYGVNLRGAIFIYSSDVVIFEILVQIYMRSKCQVKPIIVWEIFQEMVSETNKFRIQIFL